MARIAGVDLPQNKQVWIGLTYIYGIGRSRSRDICAQAEVPEVTKVRDLTEDEARARTGSYCSIAFISRTWTSNRSK